MANVIRYISIDDQTRKQIEEEVGCTYNLARLALRNQGEGDKARQVRTMALERGGVERIDALESAAIVKSEVEPNVWELQLGNGVLLRLCFEQGEVQLERDSKRIAVYPNPDMRTISSIIEYAANL